jgi:hypothetical protein
MITRDGAFGKLSGLPVMTVGSHDGIKGFIRKKKGRHRERYFSSLGEEAAR